jgi:hypothetical protein
MKLSQHDLGERQLVSREEAARQQIDMAIRLFRERQFACSITLAMAADGQMPEGDEPSVSARIKGLATDKEQNFNTVANWLKHHRPPNELPIYELDAVLALMRATSKFRQAYRDWSPMMQAFDRWWRRRRKGLAATPSASPPEKQT